MRASHSSQYHSLSRESHPRSRFPQKGQGVSSSIATGSNSTLAASSLTSNSMPVIYKSPPTFSGLRWQFSPGSCTFDGLHMEQENQEGWAGIPAQVRRITLGDKEVFLVGTAHVSERSIRDVRETIEAVRPDVVCVELDETRYRNLVDSDRWKRTNVLEVIRKGQATYLLASLILASFQRRIGKKLGVMPGAELAEGVRAAREIGAEVVLADRDIKLTLKRTWGNLGFRQKLRMAASLAASLFIDEDIDEKTIEELKREEKLNDLLELLAREFPMVKKPLIDERDVYLAQRIRDTQGKRIVAVVGAGHVPGIIREIEADSDLAPLERIPPPALWPRVLKWAIPMIIIGLLIYGGFRGGAEHSLQSLYIWVVINGGLAALGAALAFGHPLTVLTAFFVAPLTSLNPMIAAGWVAGLVQTLVKKPTVRDLEQLPESITTIRGFWGNPVSRILLVVVLANLGSALGTFIAGSWIAVRTVG
jgi:pheromone shutdown-related protein TraB